VAGIIDEMELRLAIASLLGGPQDDWQAGDRGHIPGAIRGGPNLQTPVNASNNGSYGSAVGGRVNPLLPPFRRDARRGGNAARGAKAVPVNSEYYYGPPGVTPNQQQNLRRGKKK
jgi:hypothetical protein